MTETDTADTIGVAEGTVRNDYKAGAQDYAPDTVTGQDGKSYPRPQPKPTEPQPDEIVDDDGHQGGESSSDATEDQRDDDQGTDDHSPREAKYRRRAQAAEAKLAEMAERIASYQRADAERQAAQRLGKGADLWSGGVQLEALLDESGSLSAELVEQAVTEVLAEHPHWRKPAAAPPASTVTSDGKIEGEADGNTFVDAFRPRNHL